jgi:pimeloyl-ACP methyl ester carboxylesterase
MLPQLPPSPGVQEASMAVRSFKVRVPVSVLSDLKRRLAWTRWPDEILTNVMGYSRPAGDGAHGRGHLPQELSRPPRRLVEDSYNLKQWTVMPAGGHFAAMENPKELVDDIRSFFRQIRF